LFSVCALWLRLTASSRASICALKLPSAQPVQFAVQAQRLVGGQVGRVERSFGQEADQLPRAGVGRVHPEDAYRARRRRLEAH
jgi:hypothetical protein